VTNPSKRKGDEAERELCRILADLTGFPVERKLGAGRKTDTGDVFGIPDTTVQVKNRPDDPLRSVREILTDLPQQQANAGSTFAFGAVRRRRGGWFVVMDLEQLATWMREAITPP
jgi:Holliday junction resolvase